MKNSPLNSLALRKLTVGDWQENVYLLQSSNSDTAILVDPGAEAMRILDWAQPNKIQMILLTHAHQDHVGALNQMRTVLKVPAGLHPNDRDLAASAGVIPDFWLEDDQVIWLDESAIRVVHCPGHTPGSVCLRFEQSALVGDAVFPGGPGHTNSAEELEQSLASLQRTVFTWPAETILYPGHGESTSVGKELPAFEDFLARGQAPGMYGDITWLTRPR